MSLIAKFLVPGRQNSVGQGGAFGTCFAVIENLTFAWSVGEVSPNVLISHGRAMECKRKRAGF